MERKIKLFLRQYVLCLFPGEYVGDFRPEAKRTNFRLMFALSILVFAEYLIAAAFIGTQGYAPIAAAAFGILALVFFLLLRTKIWEKPAAMTLVHIFLFCYMLFETFLAVESLQRGAPMYEFFFALLLVGTLPLLELQSSLFYLCLPSGVIIGFLISGAGPATAFRQNMAYSVLFLLMSFGISRVLYYSFAKKFVDNARFSSIKSELEGLVFQLEHLSVTDELTGISNRRRLIGLTEFVFEECKREKKPISMLMIDIDKFKLYNDNYGHLQGDRCLMQVASALAPCFKRTSDIAARYGGEEFVVVLPFIGRENAVELAERFRKEVEKLQIKHEYSDVSDIVTVSIGVSTCIPEIHSWASELLNCADEAMYEAKQQGSNRVVARELYPASIDNQDN